MDPPARFHDRYEAGRRLAEGLAQYRNQPDATVLALPRGGVPVAFELAKDLNLPLDVFVVRKLGSPGQPELAMGAIASGAVRILNNEVIDSLQIPVSAIEAIAKTEQRELDRRERLYRDGRRPTPVFGRTVILVDDGVATGSTMRAAIAALRKRHPARVVLGVPAAAPSVCRELRNDADEVICAMTPEPFYAVGLWYEDFSPVSDDEVRDLLAQALRQRPAEIT